MDELMATSQYPTKTMEPINPGHKTINIKYISSFIFTPVKNQ